MGRRGLRRCLQRAAEDWFPGLVQLFARLVFPLRLSALSVRSVCSSWTAELVSARQYASNSSSLQLTCCSSPTGAARWRSSTLHHTVKDQTHTQAGVVQTPTATSSSSASPSCQLSLPELPSRRAS
ncbi:hypothetical protein B0T26DRAFT_117908 [Lasiosphaeria miniovina]|uniref:Uncharacterized protein n=1 Tax=Lasiosphaeria miniovina TaxID=1954250 RepID=A0AA40E3W8_9PEZI|nr:uncharacterized protein B0T26DRAFT_117908 [Lasiosphaeria miniovina]KAK0727114.1 hypothetical protein B0T26DRAFT_117908 [Lasiosphaeria miniovina]